MVITDCFPQLTNKTGRTPFNIIMLELQLPESKKINMQAILGQTQKAENIKGKKKKKNSNN